ncbi:MAG: hypothetical protein SGPRY_002652 [Prymnesium sp.]
MALSDAEAAVAADPTSGKAWARKGAALHGMALWGEAIVAYEEASPHDYPSTSWMSTQSSSWPPNQLD